MSAPIGRRDLRDIARTHRLVPLTRTLFADAAFEYTDPNRAALLDDPPFLTPTDDYERLFQERATAVGVEGSDKEKGLEAAAYAVSLAMTAPGGPNEGFVRPSPAHLLVIIVSDEEDCSDNGALEGRTASNVPVYNVAYPLMKRLNPERPFRLLEI